MIQANNVSEFIAKATMIELKKYAPGSAWALENKSNVFYKYLTGLTTKELGDELGTSQVTACKIVASAADDIKYKMATYTDRPNILINYLKDGIILSTNVYTDDAVSFITDLQVYRLKVLNFNRDFFIGLIMDINYIEKILKSRRHPAYSVRHPDIEIFTRVNNYMYICCQEIVNLLK